MGGVVVTVWVGGGWEGWVWVGGACAGTQTHQPIHTCRAEGKLVQWNEEVIETQAGEHYTISRQTNSPSKAHLHEGIIALAMLLCT